MKKTNRRNWLLRSAAALGIPFVSPLSVQAARSRDRDLIITDVRITPIALPDPPLLAAGGCHGPYFLRNVIEIETDAGIIGIGETRGGKGLTEALQKCREHCIGQSAFAYRGFGTEVLKHGTSTYAGIELACLDAIGRASGRRLCELLGGPVRERVEFASYLFFRFAADHREVLNDPVRGPLIRQKLHNQYKHLLIDEFQDTSVQQWQNFIPLVDDTLAQGYQNLLVGDAKQAIYRFRNGEAKQFVLLPDIYEKQNSFLQKLGISEEVEFLEPNMATFKKH